MPVLRLLGSRPDVHLLGVSGVRGVAVLRRESMTDADLGAVVYRGECRECGKPLPAGYLCDSPECDRVEGWDD